MDLVDYAAEPFERAREAFEDFAAGLDVHDITYIPISALRGDNVVSASDRMPFYDGTAPARPPGGGGGQHDHPEAEQARLPVQWVIRPADDGEHRDYRGYAGQLASGELHAG